MRTVRIILLSVLAGAALTVPAALARYGNHSIAQREVTIPLSKTGKVNLYSVREAAHDSFEFVAENVRDPVKKKPVTGEVELRYKCGDIPYLNRLFLRRGSSRAEKVKCLMMIRPVIIIADEE